ncbi:MAG: hypothetical protein FJ316_10825 [SAR202 cluster bacterium]|nr:hypothetical protein [SAR202 cluster bacterium]
MKLICREDAGALSIQDYLGPAETLLSICQPFYATSQRVIRLEPDAAPGRQPQLREIPYHALSEVKLVHRNNHPMMLAGAAITIVGAYLVTFLLITGVLAIGLGVALLVYGGKGRPGYYQISGWGLAPQEERWWRVDYARSGSFIATLRNAAGQAGLQTY